MGYLNVVGDKIAASWAGAQGKKHKDTRAAQQIHQNAEDQYQQNKAYVDQLKNSDADYQKSMKGNAQKYQTDLDNLKYETQVAQRDTSKTYSNDIQPRLKDLMERSQKNSAGAMSLQDAMDPNNKVAQSTRDLYNKQAGDQRGEYNAEGQNLRDLYNKQGSNVQGLYETQAQGEGKKGLADVGVLSALGMQNMAGQLGGVPMTGGQMAALMGQNQAQSGAAYGQTQRRLQALRDQGLQGNLALQNQGLGLQADTRLTGLGRASDLQNRGLEQGFNRTDTAYNQGLDATDRYGKSIGNYEGAMDRQLGRDASFRGERGGIGERMYGLNSQMSDVDRGVASGDIQRRMANYNTYMGGNQATLAGGIQANNAAEAQNAKMIQGGMQTAGTVVGAVYGGPAGAAAGGAAGNAAGGAATQGMGQEQVPSYGNYGGGYYSQPNNYVEQGSQNQGASGLGLTNPYEDPYAGSSAGASRQFASNPYAYGRAG